MKSFVLKTWNKTSINEFSTFLKHFLGCVKQKYDIFVQAKLKEKATETIGDDQWGVRYFCP